MERTFGFMLKLRFWKGMVILNNRDQGGGGSCLEVKIKVATDQHKAVNKNVRNMEKGSVLFASLVLGTSKSAVSGQPLKTAYLDWKRVLKEWDLF